MRSTFAVVAGYVFIAMINRLAELLLQWSGMYPPATLLAIAYSIPITIAGAWLAARIAPNQPIRHALILGILILSVSLAGAVAAMNSGLGPPSYPIALAVLALPLCWLGGWVCARMIVLKQQDTRTQG